MQKIWDKNSLRRKNKAAVNLKTERFDDIGLGVTISSVCMYNTLLMVTAKPVLSKRPVLRFTAALFFLLNMASFSESHKKVRIFCSSSDMQLE